MHTGDVWWKGFKRMRCKRVQTSSKHRNIKCILIFFGKNSNNMLCYCYSSYPLMIYKLLKENRKEENQFYNNAINCNKSFTFISNLFTNARSLSNPRLSNWKPFQSITIKMQFMTQLIQYNKPPTALIKDYRSCYTKIFSNKQHTNKQTKNANHLKQNDWLIVFRSDGWFMLWAEHTQSILCRIRRGFPARIDDKKIKTKTITYTHYMGAITYFWFVYLLRFVACESNCKIALL